MKKQLLAAAALLLAFALPAAAGHSDLRSLTHDLDSTLAESNVDPATEAEIRKLLQEALRLARTGAAIDDRCLDVAVPIYEKSYQPADSLKMAAKMCREALDVEVLRLANGVFAQTYGGQDSLRMAAEYARREDLRGKAGLLAFAFGKYDEVYGAQDSLRMAATFVAPLPRITDSCIRRAFETYDKNYGGQDSLKMAAEFCTK